MRRDAILAGTTAFAVGLAFLFWFQLRESNKLNARLQQQMEALTRAPNGNVAHTAAGVETPRPAVSSVVAPAVQGVPADASSGAPTPDAKCEASLALTRQRAADDMAKWASELKLSPEETQRITEVRQAQLVGRSSCASAAGRTADQETLRVQFRQALGPERLAQLADLNASRGTQTYMSYLGKHFMEQEVPLSDEQARQLSAIYLEEYRRFQREDLGRVYPDGPRAGLVYYEENLKIAEERLERVQAAAQSFLRPEQLKQLRLLSDAEVERTRSSIRAVREMLEQGKPVPPPPLPSIATVMPQR